MGTTHMGNTEMDIKDTELGMDWIIIFLNWVEIKKN